MHKIKTLPERALEILEHIDPQEVVDLADDLFLISDCIGTQKDQEISPALFEAIKFEAAYLLSLFAEKYADKLTKINKKHPGFWKEIVEYDRAKRVLNENAQTGS